MINICMKIHELLEAVIPSQKDFLDDIEAIVDESLAEYQSFLDNNNDIDDIDELEEILNSNIDDELPIEFITSHEPRKDKDEWLSAAADWSEEEGKFITVYLHAKNLEKVYGPKSFKGVLMKLLGHETIHWQQYDKMGADVLNNYQSGHMKGVKLAQKTGDQKDWMRSYLRDPHELMAYAHDLAQEIHNTDNPEETLRNPERFKNELPVYQRFRDTFPANSKQIKQLMKYTADYYKNNN